MEIGHGQKLGLPRGEPCRGGRPLAFAAVTIAAGIVCDACMGTVLTALDVTTKFGSSANFDCRHHPSLNHGYMAGIG